jgi:hypothetical protein
VDLTNWELPDPGVVLRPRSDAQWKDALGKYDSNCPRPLERCLQVALANGAKTLVVETRYIDIDYRSEYVAYFAKRFDSIPNSTHRLHFFTGDIPDDLSVWSLPDDPGYVGYVVIRPSSNGPVSRAMLQPPPDLRDAIRTSVTERVSVFGRALTVTGVPFAQQDTQFGACAHVAAWMCHQTAHLRGDVERRPRADFSLLANTSMQPHRTTPTQGLSITQLSDLFRTLRLPAIFYRLGQLPQDRLPWQPAPPMPNDPDDHPGTWDHGVIPIACRYLNSGLPVLVGTTNHTFVLCGYRRSDPDNPRWIEFFRHDDQRGPYLPVGNVLADVDPVWGYQHQPWQTLHVPAPEKIWLSPEAAESAGGTVLAAMSAHLAPIVSAVSKTTVLTLDQVRAGDNLAVKTYLQRSNDFKAGLVKRGLQREIVHAHCLARMSRYVWVVEAQDRRLRAASLPCVVGQAVFDSTSDDITPGLLVADIHGVAFGMATTGQGKELVVSFPTPYLSGAGLA